MVHEYAKERKRNNEEMGEVIELAVGGGGKRALRRGVEARGVLDINIAFNK